MHAPAGESGSWPTSRASVARPPGLVREGPAPEPPRLLDQVRAAVRMRHYSRRTEEAYAAWVRRFVLFHDKRHPREMGEAEVAAFLSHLATARFYERARPLNCGGRHYLSMADVGARRHTLRHGGASPRAAAAPCRPHRPVRRVQAGRADVTREERERVWPSSCSE
jgi:hypothetical protein